MAKRKINGSRRLKDKNPSQLELVNFLDRYDDQKLEKAMSKFTGWYGESKQWRLPYRDRWLEYYQLYRSYSDYYDDRPEWQAAYFVPKCFEIVETIVPRQVNAIYDTSPMMIALPDRPNMRGASRIVERLLDTRAIQTDQFFTDVQTFKENLIYGTAYQKLHYEVSRGYEGTRWEYKDIFDIYPDPSKPEIKDMKYIFDRDVKHIEDIRMYEDMGVFRNVDVLTDEDSNCEKYISALDRLRLLGYYNQDVKLGKDYHEILEMWGKWYDQDTDEWFDVVAVIADRKHFLRFEECQYYLKDKETEFWYAIKPYVKFLDVPVPGEQYGIGEIEVARLINLYMNDNRNMMMDAKQFAISPVYQAVMAGLQEPDKIVFAPGTIIPTDYIGPVDVLKPVQKDMSWIAGFQEDDRLDRDLMNAVGIQLPLIGSEGQIRKTAREFLGLVEEGHQRIKMKNRITEIYTLHRRAQMTLAMERQYTDTDVLLKVFDEKDVKAYAKINPQQIDWEGDFRVQASQLYGMKSVIAEQQMRFLELINATPEAVGKVNIPKLLKLIAQSLEIPDKDLIIDEKEEPQPQPQPAPAELSLVGGAPGGMPTAMAPTIPPTPADMMMAQQQLPPMGLI